MKGFLTVLEDILNNIKVISYVNMCCDLIIIQFSAKRVELTIPDLAYYRGKTRLPFKMDVTLADCLNWTMPIPLPTERPDHFHLLTPGKEPLKSIRRTILAAHNMAAEPR
jgi:hypothetical protein